MTRINCIPPSELTREHLVAEYRELPRVFSLARRAAWAGRPPVSAATPPRYTLGKGHVLFFYPRLMYLVHRHQALVAEMDSRGYKARIRTFILCAGLSQLGEAWLGDWEPDAAAIEINRQRIAQRLSERTPHHAAR